MSPDRNRLHIAIQKSGRLSDQCLDLLKGAGLKFSLGGRNRLAARADNFPLDIMFVRDDDIPTFVADGVCELGIVGQNVLDEFALGHREPKVASIARLGFGRCRLAIATQTGSEPFRLELLEGERIATTYPRILTEFLARRRISAEIVEMRGAVELAPRLGIAHVVCDLVSTGATLEANGLTAVQTVLQSEGVLIRSLKPIDGPHTEKLDALLMRIEGVTATAESKYIVLNAPEAALRDITEILPGAEAPTVVPLIGRPGHVAIQAVCQESVFWETLERLKAVGASAILVMPIEKMML